MVSELQSLLLVCIYTVKLQIIAKWVVGCDSVEQLGMFRVESIKLNREQNEEVYSFSRSESSKGASEIREISNVNGLGACSKGQVLPSAGGTQSILLWPRFQTR